MFTKKPDGESVKLGSLQPTHKPSSPMPAMASGPQARSSGAMSGMATPSIIGPDLTIMGNLISKGEVQVDGEVQGDLNCAHLVVGEHARITGGIVADDVIVRGRVMGSIRGNRVTLQTSSHVEGDIYHQSLAIEQGALFEGRSRRSDNPLADAPKIEPRPMNGNALSTS